MLIFRYLNMRTLYYKLKYPQHYAFKALGVEGGGNSTITEINPNNHKTFYHL